LDRGELVIGPGVTIGDNNTIEAGRVVLNDAAANLVVAGNPARIVRQF
jgi:acetyltransferase-like isoleucine patch superfamily enzyme